MSKKLEVLEELNNLNDENVVYVHKEYWNEIQKKLKALEIIKEKVNLKVIESKDKEIHILVIENIFNVPISEETYDLLKEVLL